VVVDVFLTVIYPKTSDFHFVVLEDKINVKSAKDRPNLEKFLQLYKNKNYWL